MRIHTDHNGVTVDAIQSFDGAPAEGQHYLITVGPVMTSIVFEMNGMKGITNEALLSILIHRTKFLDAKVPCDENKRALQHLEEALGNFELRTTRRIARGVEGTSKA